MRLSTRSRACEIIESHAGIELRMWLAEPRGAAFGERRRHMAGPTGCGLCGIESLEEAGRPPPAVPAGRRFTPREIMRAVEAVAPLQALNRETRAVHGAAFWEPSQGLAALREDVGRHNALDKLGGALARERIDAGDGLIVLTSRVSVEMVQKTAFFGRPGHRRHLGADRARGAHRASRRHHAGGYRARRRL